MLFINKKYYYLLLPLLFCLQNGIAQWAETDFTRYSVKDGLSDNNINCLQQDADGYLWIGTGSGLNRFDGTRFSKYYQASSPLQLRSSVITKLECFDKGRLGIISRQGFQLLDTRKYLIQDFIIPDNTSFSNQLNAAWDAEELPGGSFALTTAAGFYVFDRKGRVTLRHDAYNVTDIGRKRILYGRNIFKVPGHEYLVYLEENRMAI